MDPINDIGALDMPVHCLWFRRQNSHMRPRCIIDVSEINSHLKIEWEFNKALAPLWTIKVAKDYWTGHCFQRI